MALGMMDKIVWRPFPFSKKRFFSKKHPEYFTGTKTDLKKKKNLNTRLKSKLLLLKLFS